MSARRSVAWLALVALLAAASAIVARATGVLDRVEHATVDVRFGVRGARAPSDRVVIVALDAGSYRALPRPPLPRTLDAQLVDRLRSAGAAVVAFDFALEQRSTPAADGALVRALRRTPHAVVSVTAVGVDGSTAPLAGRVPFGGAVRAGVTLLGLDEDGAVRRFPSALGGVPSFALAAADAAAGRSLHVPARRLIDYPGGAGTVPMLSAIDVLRGHFDARAVRGKVVVFGPTAPVLQDVHRTPVGPAVAGPEIQAAAIATALDGFPLRGTSATADTLTLVGLALAVPLLLLLCGRLLRRRSRDPRVALIGLAALVAWALVTQLAFDAGLVLDASRGALALAVATLGCRLVEARERRRLRTRFAAGERAVVERVLEPPAGGRDGSVLSASTVIAGYRLERQIGLGGMGVVYRARQLRLDRPVALKLMRPEYAHTPALRERFVREARLAAAVSHPHVIPVLDAGEDAGLLYIAMQHVDGVDLARALDGLGRLDPPHAVRLLAQIASALDAAHAAGLVHLDVKPANIVVLAEPEHAFLTDFGVARPLAGAGAKPELPVGTVQYMAPEQAAGGAPDRRADVYALAAVLFHCLTGGVPFPGGDRAATIRAHLRAPRPRPSERRSELVPALDAVVQRGMAIAPGERFESALALTDAAAAALGLEPPAALGELPERDAPSRVGEPTEASE